MKDVNRFHVHLSVIKTTEHVSYGGEEMHNNIRQEFTFPVPGVHH